MMIPMRALSAALLLCCVVAACARKAPVDESAVGGANHTAAAAGCLPGGEGRLEASLRGAIDADLAWRDAQMQCDGDLRPDGSGLRITLAGPHAGRQLRFIFGIDLADADDGPAQVLPTNLTVMVEGERLLFATRGSDRCAAEQLVRTPVAAGIERVAVRGYCLDPASDLAGTARLFVRTFSFTALLRRDRGEDGARE